MVAVRPCVTELVNLPIHRELERMGHANILEYHEVGRVHVELSFV